MYNVTYITKSSKKYARLAPDFNMKRDFSNANISGNLQFGDGSTMDVLNSQLYGDKSITLDTPEGVVEWAPSKEMQDYYRGWVRHEDDEGNEVHTQIGLSEWEEYLLEHLSEVIDNKNVIVHRLMNKTGLWNYDQIRVLKKVIKKYKR